MSFAADQVHINVALDTPLVPDTLPAPEGEPRRVGPGRLSTPPTWVDLGAVDVDLTRNTLVIAGDEESELPPIALAGGGMSVGAVILLAMCALGVQPVSVSTADVTFAGSQMPFWVPVLGLALIAAALAYATGIYAARALGTTVASFISLLEVLFAVAFAWMFVGEAPTLVQVVGGAFIVGGVVLVRLDESRHAESFGPVVAAEHDAEIERWLDDVRPTRDEECVTR